MKNEQPKNFRQPISFEPWWRRRSDREQQQQTSRTVRIDSRVLGRWWCVCASGHESLSKIVNYYHVHVICKWFIDEFQLEGTFLSVRSLQPSSRKFWPKKRSPCVVSLLVGWMWTGEFCESFVRFVGPAWLYPSMAPRECVASKQALHYKWLTYLWHMLGVWMGFAFVRNIHAWQNIEYSSLQEVNVFVRYCATTAHSYVCHRRKNIAGIRFSHSVLLCPCVPWTTQIDFCFGTNSSEHA